MTQSPLIILLVDDHPVINSGISKMINAEFPQLKLINALNGAQALDIIEKENINILITDIRMPEMDGFELLTKINDRPDLKKVIFSIDCFPSDINRAMEFNVTGYLLKSMSLSEIKSAILCIQNGGKYFAQEIQDYLNKKSSNDLNTENKHLTKRELEILKLLCKGLSNPKVAELLSISENTVKVHRQAIKTKTKTNNLSDLVEYSIKRGFHNI